MSDCSGPDCTHPSHNHEPKKEAVKTAEEQVATEARQNPIITPADPERWPLLEMQSQSCSIPLSQEDEEAIALMDAMLNTLDDQAAGLAAVQIGYPRRIFLLRNRIVHEAVSLKKRLENNAYINPVVLHKSQEFKVDNEACLSLPHMAGRFRRPKSVTIEYMDVNCEFHRETFSGFWARAVMHEMDHLNGQLIVEHIEKDLAKRPQRTKFGMRLTPQRRNVIARRRAKKQRAYAAKRRVKAIGR